MKFLYQKSWVIFCLLFLLMEAHPLSAKPLMQSIKDLLTFKIDEKILDEINQGIIGKLAAKSIRFTLPNKIEIDELEVLDEVDRRVLYGKHVKLTISLASLLTNNIRITDAFVDSPFFRYTIINEIHNVIRIFDSPPQIVEKIDADDSKMRVTIEHVEVINGNYEMYHDAGVEIFAEGIVASGNFWVENGPFGVDISDVTIAKGAIFTGGMDLPISDLVADSLWISDAKVSVGNLNARYEKAALTGKGTVFIEEERYDIDATIDAPKGTYPTGLAPLPFVAPAFRASVSMAGELTEPEFLAELSFDDTDFNHLMIKSGQLTAQINPHQITIEPARVLVGANGVVTGRGVLNIDERSFAFSSTQDNILAQELAAFLDFDREVQGLIKARTQFSGKFANEQTNIRIESQGSVRDAQLDNIKFKEMSLIDVDVDYVLDKSVAINIAKISDDYGLKLSAQGHANLITKSVAITYDAAVAQLGGYWALSRPTDAIDGIASSGAVSFRNDELALAATANIESINLFDVMGEKVEAKIKLSQGVLNISDICARLYEGELRGKISINDFWRKNTLDGEVTLQQINLPLLVRPFFSTPAEGKLSAALGIAGSMTEPRIKVFAEMEDLYIDRIELGSLQFDGLVTKDLIDIPRFSLITKSGTIDGDNISLDLVTDKIAGRGIINDFGLQSSFASYPGKVEGFVDGNFSIAGTLYKPVIEAPLWVTKLSAFGMALGAGSVTVMLKDGPLIASSPTNDLVFSLSANLSGQAGYNLVRFAMALNEKTINSEFQVEDLLVNTASFGAFPDYVGIKARIGGKLSIFGRVNSPDFHASFLAKEYGIFDPKQRDAADSIKSMLGPALFTVKNQRGRITGELCANLSLATGESKCGDDGIQASISGPFSFDEFSLDIDAHVDHPHIETVSPSLRRELVTVDADAKLRGKLRKAKNEDAKFEASIELKRLNGSIPNIPNIRLTTPTALSIKNDSISFINEANLEFLPGKLTINGSFAPKALNLNLSGEIPLMLSRLVLPIVQRAEGLAKGNISLSGSLEAPIVEGKIIPEPRSVLTFKKWIDAIEVREGSVSFSKTSSRSFVTRFDKFKLGLGDGKLFVDGNFDKRYGRGDEPGTAQFDLEVEGSNVVFRDGLDFVEADFSIQTKHMNEGAAVAKGQIIVTDGSAHRQFDLRNFVAMAQGGIKPGLFKFFSSIDMRLDLDIAIRQFRASARMLNLDIETILRGQLSAGGPIAHPKFKGAIVIAEGAIIFPATSFDLMESQIVLDETSDRVFDPKIDVVATQDLFTTDYPQLRQDTTVEFTLRGDLDRMSLGLRPQRGDMRLSQLGIFLLLLSPRGGGFEGADQSNMLRRGAQNAAMAFSGEVFLRPLANELQELLEGKTKTRIQLGTTLDAGGVSLRFSWKLGPRIELQGSYAFLSEDARRIEKEKSSFMIDSQYSLADLKLKLLLFDHRPLGPLSLETSFGSVRQIDINQTRGKVRLKYRVLTQ